MIIVSQNMANYDIPLPRGCIYRINLAWVNEINELKSLLKKHTNQKIFLDLPVGRTKPPNNKYTLDDLIPILNEYSNIKFLAISNVNNKNDVIKYLHDLPKSITLVPKIESTDGIDNINEIIDTIPSQDKIVMLDHDDLYSSIMAKHNSSSLFKKYFLELSDFCNENNVILLRTVGVIFSDEEKKITQYSK